MGGVSFIVSVLLLLFSVNTLAKLHSLRSKLHHQNSNQLPTNASASPNRRTISSSDYSFSTNAVQQLPISDSFATLPEFNEFGKKEVHENVKAIILTKRVPVPYTVHVEKKVPYPVRVPIRRPFTVFVPKPYLVEYPKPYPFAIKVPMPQPYTVEKHIPFPVKVPIDKPYPVHISKPYPVFVEKKVPVPIEKHIPVQIKIPIDRPFPVHIPVEKPVPYPVEKPVPYPVKIPIERPIPVAIEKPIHFPMEHVIEKPQSAEISSESSSYLNRDHVATLKTSASNFQPSAYDPLTSSLMQGNNKAISFLPGNTQQSYSLGTIHVPDNAHTQSWNATTTDWVPKQQYMSTKTQKATQYVPKTLNAYKYIYPERVASTLNLENIASFSDSPTLKETHGIQYEPVKYEAFKQEISKSTQQNNLQQLQQSQQQQQEQESINNYQTSTLMKSGQLGSKPMLNSNYQFFNIHPQVTSPQDTKQKETSPETSISFQKFETIQPTHGDTKWVPHTFVYTKPQMQFLTQQPTYSQQEKIQYEEVPQYTYQISQFVPSDSADQKYQGSLQYQAAEEINYVPAAQALYMPQPIYQENFQRSTKADQQLQQTSVQYQTEKPFGHYAPDMKTHYKRDEFQPHYSEPVIYEQTIEYHYGGKPVNSIAIPQTNSHTGIIEQTTTVAQQTTLPATTQQLEPTGSTMQTVQSSSISSGNSVLTQNSTKEVTKKRDDNVSNSDFEINVQHQSGLNNLENSPITYSDITRNFVRKTRRKGVGKRKIHPLRETIQQTIKHT